MEMYITYINFKNILLFEIVLKYLQITRDRSVLHNPIIYIKIITDKSNPEILEFSINV